MNNGSKKTNWFLAKPQRKEDETELNSNEEKHMNEDLYKEEDEAKESENQEEKTPEVSIFNRFRSNEMFTEPKEVGLSTIHEDVVITGDIKASSNIELYGSVTGNVECGDLIIKSEGKIEGNIAAKNLTVSSKDIKGNINCSKDIVIHQDAEIVGDICADNIVCEGRVNGNISTTQFLDLKTSAIVNGDCSFGTIAIEKGGIINGSLKVLKK